VCRINAATSFVTNSGTTQTLGLDVFFKPAFAGFKSIQAILETRANQFSPARVLGSRIVP
jgi:hypothetical protein